MTLDEGHVTLDEGHVTLDGTHMLFLAQLGLLEQCSDVFVSPQLLHLLLHVQPHLGLPFLVLKAVSL